MTKQELKRSYEGISLDTKIDEVTKDIEVLEDFVKKCKTDPELHLPIETPRVRQMKEYVVRHIDLDSWEWIIDHALGAKKKQLEDLKRAFKEL